MRQITALVSLLLLFSVAVPGQRSTEYIAKVTHTPTLSIPEDARKSGVGGEIRVRVGLDLDGNVTGVESVTGPGSICSGVKRPDVLSLRQAAAEAAKLAKFEPVVEDGKRRRAFGIVRFDVPAGVSGQPAADLETMSLGLLSRQGPDGSESYLRRSAENLPKPPYPEAARVLRASGPVSVKLLIDGDGSVFSTEALSGHPLLRASAAQAACSARFKPTLISGKPVKILGVIVYNFVP